MEKKWIAIDGTVLKRCLKSGEKEAIIHVTTHDSRTKLAQARKSGDKSSEISVVRKLLTVSGLVGRKITLDAHHFNPIILSQIAVEG